MEPHDAIAETFRTEIYTLLRANEDNIMSVLLHYKKSGRTIYEILKEPNLFTKWCQEDRVFIGNYIFTDDTEVSIFIGKGEKNNLYYKLTNKEKDKKV
jgi:hypothetical protein